MGPARLLAFPPCHALVTTLLVYVAWNGYTQARTLPCMGALRHTRANQGVKAVGGHEHCPVGLPGGGRPPANALREMRVVLYVTTAASLQHLSFMACWPGVMRHLPRLSRADAILYVGSNSSITNATKMAFRQLLGAWPCRVKTVHFGDNPGYQAGAMQAAHVAFAGGWFKGYDWVIRINPDVLIYDEGPMFALMEKEDTWGIFVRCDGTCVDHTGCSGPAGWKRGAIRQLHTDFFAVRPERVPAEAFATWKTERNAEEQAVRAFAWILSYRADTYIYNNTRDVCRVTGGGVYHGEDMCNEALSRAWQLENHSKVFAGVSKLGSRSQTDLKNWPQTHR